MPQFQLITLFLFSHIWMVWPGINTCWKIPGGINVQW